VIKTILAVTILIVVTSCQPTKKEVSAKKEKSTSELATTEELRE
jgi:hypothetical protein